MPDIGEERRPTGSAPRATYRLQLRPDFGFDAAAGIVGYLDALGISHLYTSPYLQAAAGSQHGYDVVDPTRVSADLGGAEAHARLCAELRRHGLGAVVDVVPNHMAITGPENPWWWDVLEHGPASRYAATFDVDWESPEEHLRDTVLLPVLGDHYGRVLEAGELRLAREGVDIRVRYHDHSFPLSPRTLDVPLARAGAIAGSTELAEIARRLADLPLATATDFESVERRHEEWQKLRARLGDLLGRRAELGRAIDTALDEIQRDDDALDALLDRQNYRLAFWRAAARDLGYRRFFDIDGLVGLRVEDARVFAATHSAILAWVAAGAVDGLRIDHVDGLRDPERYLCRLAARAPKAWIVVEKILEPGETLRATWPVAGTTGYEFANRVGRLLVDPAGEEPLAASYAAFIGERREWARLAREKKLLTFEVLLGSDVNRLTALLVRIGERKRRYRDYTRHELHEALKEVLACFPVYRTYVDPVTGRVEEDDARTIAVAIAAAKGNRSDLDPRLFDFLGDLLALRHRGALEDEFALRFQQLSGPAMAKGVEDTAFYSYHRLISLCEVGGDPAQFAVSPERFHAECAAAAAGHPRGMLATSTHDTKRSADVRARLHLLSEIPERWAAAAARWSAHNRRHRRAAGPDPNAEYLLYQTLVGAWPIEAGRVCAFMEKACREAKEFTSWRRPDADYETAVRGFVADALADPGFIRDLEAFVAPLVRPGRVNALTQELLKLTSPGVPDLYQGSELWDLSLVDPDNRRPVDFGRRRRMLDELRDASVEDVMDRFDDGAPKLWLISRALELRRRRPELFDASAGHAPISATGARSGHLVAFVRGSGALVAAPRLVFGLDGRWGDTRLAVPPGRWRNVFTGDAIDGGEIGVTGLLARFPVALLERQRVTA